jgi:four helix bundle protein
MHLVCWRFPVINSFRDLTVWHKALTLAEHVYLATEEFPKSEAFGLTSQMRRAAVSIPSNIAEGKAISGRAYPKHLRIALGSEAELQTQIELAVRLKMLPQSDGPPFGFSVVVTVNCRNLP